MGSSSKRRQTMAKMTRERALQEKRERKRQKKEEKKEIADAARNEDATSTLPMQTGRDETPRDEPSRSDSSPAA